MVKNKRGRKVGFDFYFTAHNTCILQLDKHDWSTKYLINIYKICFIRFQQFLSTGGIYIYGWKSKIEERRGGGLEGRSERVSWYCNYIFITVYHDICNDYRYIANFSVDVDKLSNHLKYCVMISIYVVQFLFFIFI